MTNGRQCLCASDCYLFCPSFKRISKKRSNGIQIPLHQGMRSTPALHRLEDLNGYLLPFRPDVAFCGQPSKSSFPRASTKSIVVAWLLRTSQAEARGRLKPPLFRGGSATKACCSHLRILLFVTDVLNPDNLEAAPACSGYGAETYTKHSGAVHNICWRFE